MVHGPPPTAPPPFVQRARNQRREEDVLAIVTACQQRGVLLTPSRRRVLHVLAQAEMPLKAYAILEVIRSELPTAAPAAVYRALEFLDAQGWLVRLNSINAYLLRPPGKTHACTYLVCEHCEQVTIVAVSRTDCTRTAGFVPSSNALEIAGTCAGCHAAAKPSHGRSPVPHDGR